MLFIKKWYFKRQLTKRILNELVDSLYKGHRIDIPSEVNTSVSELFIKDGHIHASGAVETPIVLETLQKLADHKARHSADLQDFVITNVIKGTGSEVQLKMIDNPRKGQI